MHDLRRSILGLSLTLSFIACGGKSDDVGGSVANGGSAGASIGIGTGNATSTGTGTGAVAASTGGAGTASASSTRGGAATSGAQGGAGATATSNSTASAGAAVVTSCAVHADCVLASVTCCGTCGAPSKGNVIAIASDSLAAHHAAICGSGPVMCPACASMLNPELFATCDAGVCKVVDLTESKLTTCSVVSDCALRSTSCCPPCGAVTDLWSLVSIRSGVESDFRSLVCDAGTVCGKCASSYPTNAAIGCSNGHCALSRM